VRRYLLLGAAGSGLRGRGRGRGRGRLLRLLLLLSRLGWLGLLRLSRASGLLLGSL